MHACCCCCCVFFFLQAEDGIRDWSVTGVQTCALPISAIKGFFDPSVQFALEFDPGKTAEELPEDLLEAVEELAKAEQETTEKLMTADNKQDDVPAVEAEKKVKKSDQDTEDSDGGGEVVSLDAFRKKT